MENKGIILTQEEWDRVIDLLDRQYNIDPDAAYLLAKITNQFTFSSDQLYTVPHSPTFSPKGVPNNE